MSLLRAAGRSMLASFFVVQGAKTALKPEALVSDAEPVADKIVPLVHRFAPIQVKPFIPKDTKTLVRYTGAAQVVSGLGLATGIGRRPASSVLAATMVPHVLASRAPKGASADEKATARALLLRNVALLGATLIAANDTEGKPSLAYRASREQRKLAKAMHHQQSGLAKAVSEKQEQVAKVTRKQKKQLAKQTKVARKQAAKKAKVWQKEAEKQRKVLAKQAKKQGKQLDKNTAKQRKQLGKKADRLTGQVREQASSAVQQLQSAID